MKFLKVIAIAVLSIVSCSKSKITPPSAFVTLNFSHQWDGATVTKSDFNTIKFTNANWQQLSIERLRYLVSTITLTNTEKQKTIIKAIQLVNLGEEKGLSLTSDFAVPQGKYKLSFTFGLNDADNLDGVYQELNSVSFNVPTMLGGGYHFMQFDGKFKGSNSLVNNFNYHVISAVNRDDLANVIFKDTSFKVNLGDIVVNESGVIAVKMDISEWFKNPNLWDLNALNSMLMSNFNAQVLMSANGESVFSLGAVIP